MSESRQGWVSALLRTEHVPWQRRLIVSLVFGCIAGAVTARENGRLEYPRDFGQVWFAARAVIAGADPYAMVGPGLTFDWPFPLLYPLPAAILAIPFASLSMAAASVVFSVVAGSAFAWSLMRYGYATLFGFFGASLHFAAETAQWSPLFAAAVVVPPLAVCLAAKPTIGAAIFAARPSWWAIVGAIVLLLVAFVVQPTWSAEWQAAIAQNNDRWSPDRPYRQPVTFLGGAVALAAILRWRRPEARLVVALACVPQGSLLYESVPLFLVPRTFIESAILVACSYAQHFIEMLVPPARTQSELLDLRGRWVALAMYVPATIMVLRRPNEGALPDRLERLTVLLPTWLRGRASIADD